MSVTENSSLLFSSCHLELVISENNRRCLASRVYFARDFIFFKGPNNVIGLYWRLKFEITQPSDFVMIFFRHIVVNVLFSNLFGSCIFKPSYIKFKKFGRNIAQLLCLDLYKYKISRQID